MTIQEQLLDTLTQLPPDKQTELLDFAEFLKAKSAPQSKAKAPWSMMGAFQDLDIHITSEDIDEARREMWGNFPREDI